MDIIRDWSWDDQYQQNNNQLFVFDRACNETFCDELKNLFMSRNNISKLQTLFCFKGIHY